MATLKNAPVALIIMDGCGLGDKTDKNNAVQVANTPVLDGLLAKYKTSQLQASGEFVGLPDGYGLLDIISHKADDALAILMYTPKAAAPVMEKLLLSAIANAENNLSMDRGSLYVAEVYANPGPTLKRYVARSRGSASPMLRRTSHITIVLDQK